MAAVNRTADGWVVDFPPLDRDLRFEPDPVIEAYKKDIDRTLLQQNLRRTRAERLRNLRPGSASCSSAKDLEAVAELEALWEERRKRGR